MKTPIAIVGMASTSAAGDNKAHIWENLCGIKRNFSNPHILHKDALEYPFLAASYFNTKERLKSAKDTYLLAEYAFEQALLLSGLTQEIQKEQTSIVMGTTAGSALHFIESYALAKENNFQSIDFFNEQIKKLHYTDKEDYFHANLALELRQKYSTHGASLTLANACTSGADAIGIAIELIRAKECIYALCGGADALSLVPHSGFARLMVYDNEPCKPFDATRKGLNLGEAAAVFVLEDYEHAKQRNAHIYGYITGYGSASDAYHFTAPHPEARGLSKAVCDALDDSGITSADLAFINAHATSTRENDLVEGRYLKSHFADIPIWASKPITGHTLGAAGALEALFSLYALSYATVPHSLGFQTVDEKIGLLPTSENMPIEKKYALSTSLGFGGGNAALIVSTDEL